MAARLKTKVPVAGRTGPDALVQLVRRRTENIYMTGQLLCTEVVLSVLNDGFDGDLPSHLAVRLASGLPEGLSGSGCICGALNGGALAMGLFLGRNGPGLRNNQRVKRATRMLHDRFREQFGSTCCRVLTRNLEYGSRAHFRHCAGLTGMAAGIAAEILLKERPDLTAKADLDYLRRLDSRWGAGLSKIAGIVRS